MLPQGSSHIERCLASKAVERAREMKRPCLVQFKPPPSPFRTLGLEQEKNEATFLEARRMFCTNASFSLYFRNTVHPFLLRFGTRIRYSAEQLGLEGRKRINS